MAHTPSQRSRANASTHKGTRALASQYGDTPLMHASSSGYSNSMKVLIAKGADVNAKDDAKENARAGGATALTRASGRGRTEAIKVLIAEKAEVDTKDDKVCATGCRMRLAGRLQSHTYTLTTSCSDACTLNATTKARLLSRSQDGCTPLMKANLRRVPTDAIKTLIKAGADVNAKDKVCTTCTWLPFFGATRRPVHAKSNGRGCHVLAS